MSSPTSQLSDKRMPQTMPNGWPLCMADTKNHCDDPTEMTKKKVEPIVNHIHPHAISIHFPYLTLLGSIQTIVLPASGAPKKRLDMPETSLRGPGGLQSLLGAEEISGDSRFGQCSKPLLVDDYREL